MENNGNFTNNGSDSDNMAENATDQFHPKTFVIVNCALNGPLMLVAILGNALVLAAIMRTASIRSSSMIMLCSLAGSDLLVGFVAQPLFIADELIKENLVLHHVSAMIGFSVCGISLATITAISVDRFLALHYHMTYPCFVTESRVIYTIIIIWVLAFTYSGFHLWNTVAFHLISALLTGVCLGISTLCYIRIYRIVRRHRLQIHVQEQATRSHLVENQTHRITLKRSALNTFVFYIFMIACYFPSYVLLFLFGISYTDWKTEWSISTTIVFLNSSLNPILFCWRIRELHGAVVNTTRSIFCA